MADNQIDINVKLMQSVEFFSKFEPGELAEVAKHSLITKYIDFDYVVKEGVVDDCSFYIVLSGKLAVYKARKGFAQKIALLGKGECFGEMSILLEEGRSTSVQATGDCFLLCLNSQTMVTMPLAIQLKLAWAIGKALAQKLKKQNLGSTGIM